MNILKRFTSGYDTSQVDSQGVPRGNCMACKCSNYKAPIRGYDCEKCSHKPVYHEQLGPAVKTEPKICKYPDCTRPVWVENNKQLDFCGKTHALQYQDLKKPHQGIVTSTGPAQPIAQPNVQQQNDNYTINNNTAVHSNSSKVLWVSTSIDKGQYALIKLLKKHHKVIKAFDCNEALSDLLLLAPFSHIIVESRTDTPKIVSEFFQSVDVRNSNSELTLLSKDLILSHEKQLLLEQYVKNVFTYKEFEDAIIQHQPQKIIYFYDRNAPFYEFTNFWEGNSIQLDGKLWPTSEHYFQAQKFVNSVDLMEKVRKAACPRDAFDLSRQHNSCKRNDWEAVKDEVMKKVVLAKFTQHPQLRNLLLSTGNAILVEHTKNDNYWGDGGDGTGKNMLGTILMHVRELIANEPKQKPVHVPMIDVSPSQVLIEAELRRIDQQRPQELVPEKDLPNNVQFSSHHNKL